MYMYTYIYILIYFFVFVNMQYDGMACRKGYYGQDPQGPRDRTLSPSLRRPS